MVYFMSGHEGRAHSKYSASGAERWFHCQGSVAASEGVEDKPTPWAHEGTRAHEVLEALLDSAITGKALYLSKFNREMVRHAKDATDFIMGMHATRPEADISVEERIYLKHIHPEMFGTYDSKIAEVFGILDVFDYKYGAGHSVSPKKNLQMIFYALGVAHQYNWNFTKVRMWIIQPRVKGYDGPLFWEITIAELKEWEVLFREAVERVEKYPHRFTEGSWCHWCKGKVNCPLKKDAKLKEAQSIFGSVKNEGTWDYGSIEEKAVTAGLVEIEKETEDEEPLKSEADWKKEARQKGKRKKGSNRRSRSDTSECGDFF